MAATDIVALADAKKQLNIPTSNTIDDDELAGYVAGVTGAVEYYVGAVIHRTVTETFDGGRCSVLLTQRPVVSVASVTDSGTVLAASDYKAAKSGVLTRVAGTGATPFLPGYQSLVVVYTAGQAASIAEVTSTLPHVRLAALLIIQHMWETQRPAAGFPSSQAADDYDPRYSYSIPRRALELLGEPVGGIA